MIDAPVMSEAGLAESLIRTFSPSGRESGATAVLVSAFESLGYDEAYLDEAGNAVGILREGAGPTLMLTGHLDTVPLGDEKEWPYPPLSGAIADGRIWGRGACDMKSAVSCMTFAALDARERGFIGTLVVAGAVLEEVGGLGSYHLAETLRPDIVVLGEPSNLSLKLGHRGRVELHGIVPGCMAHAAKAELGENALNRAAAFLSKLEGFVLPEGGPLKRSTATPTYLVSHPKGGTNVVPGSADLIIDYRNVPGDEPEDILRRIQALDPGIRWTIPDSELVTENGKIRIRRGKIVGPYLTPGESRAVERSREIICSSLAKNNLPYKEGVWWFATDAPQLARFGAPVIGFGPGEEELAHTTRESIPLEHLPIAREVYADLICGLLVGP